MSTYRIYSVTRLLWATSSATLLLVGMGIGAPAFSQSAPVTVDLSVLNDGGYGPATIPGYAGGASKLLMPGTDAPKSAYFGPSVFVSNPILTAPSTPTVSEPVVASTLSAADTVPPPAPEPVDILTPTTAVETTTAAAMPDPIPAAPAEPGSETVALEPGAPDMPPAAPEPMETETISSVPSTAPASEPETSSEAESTEIASASSLAGGLSEPGRALQVIFGDAESRLPGDAGDELSAIAEKIKGSDNFRIQLMAYAGGEGLSASKAHRLSLSRALSVRSFFIENGVRSTRIDVRALGDKTNEQPINRVDINIVER
ncbi:MAG: OmpA family protein [Alphaproteobacteria bacterium]|nr:OmpA family protein [Alphaproteobacteria bacterium]